MEVETAEALRQVHRSFLSTLLPNLLLLATDHFPSLHRSFLSSFLLSLIKKTRIHQINPCSRISIRTMAPKRRPSDDRSSDDKTVFIPPERTMNAAQYAATARGSSTPEAARAGRAARAALLSAKNNKISTPASNRAPVIAPELLNPSIAEPASTAARFDRTTASYNGLLPARDKNITSASKWPLGVSERDPIIIKEEDGAELDSAGDSADGSVSNDVEMS